MDDTILENQASTHLLPVSTISIPDLVKKINPQDKKFFKYIPDEFLNEEQIQSKKHAHERDAKKYGRNIEFNKKNRVTAAQFASQEAIAITPHSPRSAISIFNSDQIVNPSAQEISDKVSRSRNASETVTLSKGQIAALRANYEGDKVFTKKEVAAAVKSIDALQKLPSPL